MIHYHTNNIIIKNANKKRKRIYYVITKRRTKFTKK
jgi:hypothetical protein